MSTTTSFNTARFDEACDKVIAACDPAIDACAEVQNGCSKVHVICERLLATLEQSPPDTEDF